MKSDIQAIEKYVKEKFQDEGTGHDWFHIDRVRRLSLYIQEQEGGDRNLIEIAALLHDISDHKFNGGDFEKGGDEARIILQDFNVDQKLIQKAITIINAVSFKGNGVANNMTSLEGKIVQDADRLDAIGAIGIARTFAYGGSVNQPIYNPSIKPSVHNSKEEYQNRTHTINHFYEKLLILEERMHTKTAKSIAEERTSIMREYLKAFYSEWNFKK
ncbi:MAG: phosphohydrolase [Fluviicola sp.]|nr:MAG: phosphohydrolase [Fluviicola sp.]